MSSNEIIRAWKDEDYLESLSEEQRSKVPENPVGMVELSDQDMEVVAGGSGNFIIGFVSAGDDVEFSQNNAFFSFCIQ